jgi:hypothetical protein
LTVDCAYDQSRSATVAVARASVDDKHANGLTPVAMALRITLQPLTSEFEAALECDHARGTVAAQSDSQ